MSLCKKRYLFAWAVNIILLNLIKRHWRMQMMVGNIGLLWPGLFESFRLWSSLYFSQQYNKCIFFLSVPVSRQWMLPERRVQSIRRRRRHVIDFFVIGTELLTLCVLLDMEVGVKRSNPELCNDFGIPLYLRRIIYLWVRSSLERSVPRNIVEFLNLY